MTEQPPSAAMTDGRTPAMDDASAVVRAVAGDVAAFGVLARRYSPMMRAYARRMMNGADEADDVVQDSILVAWRRLADLDDPSRVRAWLMRITGRMAVARGRARRPTDPHDSTESAPGVGATPAAVVETRLCREALAGVLRSLPRAQRQSWLLREVDGCSYDEIAGHLDVSVPTVRGLLARARRAVLVGMQAWR